MNFFNITFKYSKPNEMASREKEMGFATISISGYIIVFFKSPLQKFHVRMKISPSEIFSNLVMPEDGGVH